MSVPLATLEVMSARKSDEPLGTIVFVVRDQMNTATVRSLLQTDFGFAGGMGAFDLHLIQGNILPLQRNEAIQRMRGHFLIFVDDDMTWEPDAFERLVDSFFELDHDFDEPIMVGGLCFRRTPPFQPTLYMRQEPTTGPYNFLESWDTDVVEVDATGCAFLLIPKTAIEAVVEAEMPPLEIRQTMQGPPAIFHWVGRMGEDLRFCSDAKEKGVRIFVDTRVKIGHIGEVEITEANYLAEIATRSADLEEQRRAVNLLMGLPTLSADDARKKLGW